MALEKQLDGSYTSTVPVSAMRKEKWPGAEEKEDDGSDV